MGEDDEAPGPVYAYEGERSVEVETIELTSGAKTAPVTLLGARSGAGAATYPEGSKYEGGYEDGLREGQGAYTYAAPPPGEEEEPKPPLGKYDGGWKVGEKSGNGIMELASGHKYHGAMAAGKMSGTGTMYYPNGDIYTGGWEAGLKSGAGTYFFAASGTKVAGMWVSNVLSSGEFSDKHGNKFTGAFSGSATGVSYVAGGTFELASGAVSTVTAPTKAELVAELTAFDVDKNGLVDKFELKSILTRPGTGATAMSDADADALLATLTMLFDSNADGKLSVAECASAILAQG